MRSSRSQRSFGASTNGSSTQNPPADNPYAAPSQYGTGSRAGGRSHGTYSRDGTPNSRESPREADDDHRARTSYGRAGSGPNPYGSTSGPSSYGSSGPSPYGSSSGPTPYGSSSGPTPYGSSSGPTPYGSSSGPTPYGSGYPARDSGATHRSRISNRSHESYSSLSRPGSRGVSASNPYGSPVLGRNSPNLRGRGSDNGRFESYRAERDGSRHASDAYEPDPYDLNEPEPDAYGSRHASRDASRLDSRVSSSATTNYTPRGRATSRYTGQGEPMDDLKEIFNNLKYDWPSMLDDSANPIEMAVALLDDTSVGLAHKYPEFEEIKKTTSQALRRVVNAEYETFNGAIRSYHAMLPMLDKVEGDADGIRTMLATAQREMHTSADALTDLSASHARVVETLDIVDAIGSVMRVPERVDELVAERAIHKVYDVVAEGYQLAEKHRLWSLPALSGLHAQLEAISGGMVDMIIDELHQEIYLKLGSGVANSGLLGPGQGSDSGSSNPQLVQLRHLRESASLEQFVYNAANVDAAEVADTVVAPYRQFASSQLPRLHAYYSAQAANQDFSAVLDAQSSAASQRFVYIYQLLATASKLGRLSQVCSVLVERAQSEFHQAVGRCSELVKSRHAAAIAKLAKLSAFDHSHTAVVIGDPNYPDTVVPVLVDLFAGVFFEALAVIQHHAAVAAIAPMLEASAEFDLEAVWQVVRSELAQVLDTYIYNPSRQTEVVHAATSAVAEVGLMHELFKLDEAEIPALQASELEEMMHDMFPSFRGATTNKTEALSSPYIETEQFNASVEVVAPKDLFNMRIALEFFLVFVAGAEKVAKVATGGGVGSGVRARAVSNTAYPPGKGPEDKPAGQALTVPGQTQSSKPVLSPAPSQVFSTFMEHRFLARVRDNLDFVFVDLMGRDGHFKTDTVAVTSTSAPTNQVSSLPAAAAAAEALPTTPMVYQNAVDFRRMWLTVCSVLNTSIHFRHHYSGEALALVARFGDRYNLYYDELITSDAGDKPVSQIAKWLRVPSLVDISSMLLHADAEATADRRQLMDKEVAIMFAADRELLGVTPDDFLDDEACDHVTHLLLTASWVCSWLPQFKAAAVSDPVGPDAPVVSPTDQLKQQWQFLEQGKLASPSAADTVQLALDPDNQVRFDGVGRQFASVADKAALALRYHVRGLSLYHCGQSFASGDWCPVSEPADADRFVSVLNKDIYTLNNKLAVRLSDRHRLNVYGGLDTFLNRVLIQGSFVVSKISAFGVKRVMLNIYILQQMLRNLAGGDGADFTLSVAYYDLFSLNEHSFIQEVRENPHKFSKPEFMNMARLVYSEKLADGGGSSFAKSKYADLRKKIENEYQE
ncbi:hypothetical protein DICA0_F13388 [Diutina catenulata]